MFRTLILKRFNPQAKKNYFSKQKSLCNGGGQRTRDLYKFYLVLLSSVIAVTRAICGDIWNALIVNTWGIIYAVHRKQQNKTLSTKTKMLKKKRGTHSRFLPQAWGIRNPHSKASPPPPWVDHRGDGFPSNGAWGNERRGKFFREIRVGKTFLKGTIREFWVWGPERRSCTLLLTKVH